MFEKIQLSNGLPLFLIPHHAQPLTSIRLVMRGGARNDGKLPGLADMTCSLLSAGAGERDAVMFARDAEQLGADIGMEAGRDAMAAQLDILTQFLPEGLPMMGDMLLRPRFEDEEVDRERKQRRAILKQNHSDSDWLAGATLRRALYGTSPYGHPIDGIKESIGKIGINECRGFHGHYILSGHPFIIAAGDLQPDSLIPLLEGNLGTWPGENNGTAQSSSHSHSDATLPPATERSIVIVDRPGSAHTAIRIGAVTIPRSHSDFIPLRILNTLFGDYFNSRLNMLLRESLGYTYEAWSYVEGTIDPGMFVAGTSVRADRVGESVEAIFNELDRIASEPISSEELETVKGYVAGRQALASETPDQIAALVATIALHNLPEDYYSRRIEQVRELTAEELGTIAQRYLQSKRMTVIVAGDAAKIQSQLQKFGEVHIAQS